jgi:hypothetical protein
MIHLLEYMPEGYLISDVALHPGPYPAVYDLLPLSDGTVLMVSDELAGPEGDYNVGLSHMTVDGEILGYRTFGGAHGDDIVRMIRTRDGGFVGAGWTWGRTEQPALDNFYVARLSPYLESGSAPAPVPSTVTLSNYPNPFNPTTDITFDLPKSGQVSLTVHDILGRAVAQVVNGHMTAGHHSVQFDASSLPSGVYFGRLRAGTVTRTQSFEPAFRSLFRALAGRNRHPHSENALAAINSRSHSLTGQR